MHHIIILFDSSKSMDRRLVESAKDLLMDIMPRKDFKVSFVIVSNKPMVLVKDELYTPQMLENLQAGHGLSNLGLALSECYNIAMGCKNSTSILYVGDGTSTDDFNPIQMPAVSIVRNQIALLLTRNLIYSEHLQGFEKYAFNEEEVNKLRKRLCSIIEY